jgi:hypothetical protein
VSVEPPKRSPAAGECPEADLMPCHTATMIDAALGVEPSETHCRRPGLAGALFLPSTNKASGWKSDDRRAPPTRRNRSFAFKDGQVAVLSTMSAAFSPIMIDGALVLPDVSVGMIEASAIRRPAMPWTRSWASTTAIGSDPILQVPTGW